MSRRGATAPARAVRWLVAAAAVVLVGVVAFLVTVNRTQVSGNAASATRPPAKTVVVPSPTMTLDDVARAQLSRTVTIEALGTNAEGLGTGWLMDGKGDFVTNAHVIQGQLTVRIRGRDGSAHVGDILGTDRDVDIAVIRSRDGFSGAPLLPQPAALRLPEPVVVIASGNATGHGDITHESATAVQAVVPVTGDTNTGQPPVTTEYHDMLVLNGQQIFAGNSGGPVLDAAGRVVGILTLASKSSAEAYAIQLSRVLGELLSFASK